ncbi:MAG TPA: roadblock/LC7 domain-containing protein [Trebonia sp.]|jgi:predicted regulator of Ras-like GTPase activity (Roadblock/LC7/MglB family)|nr:roadblock/LC7 domain-containing protein [Trebonia sp.]
MTHTAPRGLADDINWLLRGLLERVPRTRSAVLVSSDGLMTAAEGLDRDGADHLAAIAAALFSIARNASGRFGNASGVRQVIAELNDILLFVSSAGAGSVLVVLADRDADAGVLGYEMAQLVKGSSSFLSTAARLADAGQD